MLPSSKSGAILSSADVGDVVDSEPVDIAKMSGCVASTLGVAGLGGREITDDSW